MFLKSIELEGFKSFAENTHVEFGDGISAIIGANSSGKSNIADAVAWVLLEGKNSGTFSAEELIFNGNEKHAKSETAKVTLTFVDETKITRTVARTGEDNFFINEKPTTENEVRSLLEKTGICKNSCVVINQDVLQKLAEDKSDKNLSESEKAYAFISSTLSSTGEKVLPLYVLDDIDAFFDAKHIERFIELLRKVENKTQLIVITHNKKVIQAASQMIGVSVNDIGVSKVMSLSLDKNSRESE